MSVPDPRLRAAHEQMIAAGATSVFPPAVLPARTVLEVSGEAVRARMCVFSDNSGTELAMRPDMTTPIAALFADGAIGEGRHVYCGDVYRLPRAGRAERVDFEQVGFEWFGEAGSSADAEAFAAAAEMTAAVGATGCVPAVGDVGLFHAVIDGLGFSEDWAGRLKRSFSRVRGPEALLAAALQSSEALSGSMRLGQALSNMEPADAVQAVEEMIESAGVPVFAGRTAEEVVQRLIGRAQSRLPDQAQVSALKSYLEIRRPLNEAVNGVSEWASQSAVDVDRAIDELSARHERIVELAPNHAANAVFDASLGRRFEYYDGFAFEFAFEGSSSAPFLSGGRYDGLIARMQPQRRVAAIGAALRADRLGPAGGAA